MILRAVAPDHRRTAEAAAEAEEQTNETRDTNENQSPSTPTKGDTKGPNGAERKTGYGEEGAAEELRAVLAVIRHGDRTPKQKMKMKVRHAPLLDLLSRCTSGRPRKQAKLKTPQRLQELLNICRLLYSDSLEEGRRFAAEGDARRAGAAGRAQARRRVRPAAPPATRAPPPSAAGARGARGRRGRSGRRSSNSGSRLCPSCRRAGTSVASTARRSSSPWRGTRPGGVARARVGGGQGAAERARDGGAADFEVRRGVDAPREEPG